MAATAPPFQWQCSDWETRARGAGKFQQGGLAKTPWTRSLYACWNERGGRERNRAVAMRGAAGRAASIICHFPTSCRSNGQLPAPAASAALASLMHQILCEYEQLNFYSNSTKYRIVLSLDLTSIKVKKLQQI